MTAKKALRGDERLDSLGRPTIQAPPVDRFNARHQKQPDTGCWQWDVLHPKSGYGTIKANGKNVLAHRWAYEHFVGTIPDGLQIDHLCRNRGCVNPDHLEAVTPRENTMRGFWGVRSLCSRGHRFDGRTPNGWRYCKACRRINDRRNRRERAAS